MLYNKNLDIFLQSNRVLITLGQLPYNVVKHIIRKVYSIIFIPSTRVMASEVLLDLTNWIYFRYYLLIMGE
jgi:hypothetical protein